MVNELWQHSSVAQGLKEEGREEERAEAREIARIALESRFGMLGDDVLAAIQRADEPTLKAVVACKTLEDVQTRLGLS